MPKEIQNLAIYFVLTTFLNPTFAFSECKISSGIVLHQIPNVSNCLSLIAYYQSQGQNPQKWCENQLNYQRCCLTCQNYLRLPYCSDIANEGDCKTRAFLGLCDSVLSNNIPVRSYCQKSCGNCDVPTLTCSNLYTGCSTGICQPTIFFSIQSVRCTCPADRGGPYCNQVNPCFAKNPCQNGGACSPNYENGQTSYTCSCPAGCHGKNCETCETACTNYSCLNGGYCVIQSNGHPYCVCPTNFNGTFCEKLINRCDSNPCLNGAECVPLYNSHPSYTCKCLPGCSGFNCEHCNSGCKNYPCLNGGYCTLNPNSLPYCICPSNYIGNFCETKIINSCSSRPCLNGGSCQSWYNNDYKCVCPPNYTGRNCGYVIPSDVCIRGDLDSSSCYEWKIHGFCDYNYLFRNIPVPLYCPISCGVCTYPPCLDVEVNCPLWASYGFCNYLNTSYPGLCKRSCNTC